MMKKLLLCIMAIAIVKFSHAQLNGTWSATYPFTMTTAQGVPWYCSATSANSVWICANSGNEFMHTQDMGLTWTVSNVSTGAGWGWSSIVGLDSVTAWATFYNSGSGSNGRVYKTTDGGATWTQQTVAYTSASFANFSYFWNANEGITLGDPKNNEYEIYSTMDGGTTWTAVPGANIADPLAGEYGLTDSYCTSGNSIWAGTTGGRILFSHDKGMNWGVMTTMQSTTDYISRVAFRDSLNGMYLSNDAQGNYLGIYKTNDGGATWTMVSDGQTDIGGIFQPLTISYVPGTTGSYVVTAANNGDMGSAYTNDEGVSWTNIDLMARTYVSFISKDYGWSGVIDQNIQSNGASSWAGLIGFNEIDNATNAAVFPNPALDVINVMIQKSENEEVAIEVVDMLGNLVYSTRYTPVTNNFAYQIDAAQLAQGTYMVKVKTNNAETSHRIVKL